MATHPRSQTRLVDTPREEQIERRGEVIGVLEKERPQFGKKDLEALVDRDLRLVGLDLAEIGIDSQVQRDPVLEDELGVGSHVELDPIRHVLVRIDVQHARAPGRGVRGVVDGVEVLVGRRTLFDAVPDDLEQAATAAENDGRTAVLAGWAGSARGVFVVSDVVKATSAEAVDALHGLGLTVHLLTGDNARHIQQYARRADAADPVQRAEQLVVWFLPMVKALPKDIPGAELVVQVGPLEVEPPAADGPG